jgi:hypothetical protein
MSKFTPNGVPNLPAILRRHQEAPCRQCLLRFPPVPERYIEVFGVEAALVLTHLLTAPQVLMLTTPKALLQEGEFFPAPIAKVAAATHLTAAAQAAALRLLGRFGVVEVREDLEGCYVRIAEDALEAALCGSAAGSAA